TAGTRIVAGRELTWTDMYELRPVVLVSENLARELWGTPAAAVGKRIRQFSGMPWREIIGVARGVRETGADQPATAIVYWPSLMQFPGPQSGVSRLNARRTMTFVVRSNRAGSEAFLDEVRKAVWSVNSSLPVAATRTMRDVYEQSPSVARISFTLV